MSLAMLMSLGEHGIACNVSSYKFPDDEGEGTMASGTESTWQPGGQVRGGTLLRGLRRAADLTLLELAGRLNDADVRIDASHLQRIESGQIARPTADTL